jgi:hypothetical protein
MKQRTDLEVLNTSWLELNEVVRAADEQTCLDLLDAEMKGKRRSQFALRIWSRFNRMRGLREKAELQKKLKNRK